MSQWKKSTFKNLSINISILIISTIISLFVLELYACIFLKINYFTLDRVVPVFDEQIKNKFSIYDEELGFLPGPVWEGKDGIYGFQNGREYLSIMNDYNDYKDIVIIGDSVIQSRYLEYAFKYLLKGKPYRIWNAGIGGYNTIQEAYYLEKDIKIAPDILFLGFCLNDFIPSMMLVSNGGIPKSKFAQQLCEPLGYANSFLFKHSALYRYFKLKRIYLAKENSMWSKDTVLNNIDTVKKGLNKIHLYCSNRKIPFLVIVYPHLQDYSLAEAGWLMEAHVSILKILNELGIRYIDLHDKFKSIDFEKLKEKRSDPVHLNREGHFIAAKNIIDKFYPEIGLAKKDTERIVSVDYNQHEKENPYN